MEKAEASLKAMTYYGEITHSSKKQEKNVFFSWVLRKSGNLKYLTDFFIILSIILNFQPVQTVLFAI